MMLKFNLSKLMKERRLSIQDVSNATNISRPTISQLYNGNSKGIQFETLNRLLNGLDVDLYELFEDVFPSNHLHFDVDFIDKNDTDPIDEDEPKLQALFFYEENQTENGTVLAFRMPLLTYLDDNNLILLSDYDALEYMELPQRSELALVEYIQGSKTSSLELMMGEIAMEVLKIIKNNNINEVIFRSDIGSSALNPKFDGYSFAFLWNISTLKSFDALENYVILKYGLRS